MVDASTDYLFWFKLYKQSETTLKLCSEAISTIPNDLGMYNIFADNYYGSLPLAEKIMSHGFDLTLGLRKNRKESSFLISQLKKNQIDSEAGPFAVIVNRSNDLAIHSWKDKADFYFLSTTHSNQLNKTIRRENL